MEKECRNINWHSKAALTLRDTTAAFRIYVKEMPEQDSCLRAELNNSFKDPKTLSEKTKDIAKGDNEDQTSDDFLKDRSVERKDENDNEASL